MADEVSLEGCSDAELIAASNLATTKTDAEELYWIVAVSAELHRRSAARKLMEATHPAKRPGAGEVFYKAISEEVLIRAIVELATPGKMAIDLKYEARSVWGKCEECRAEHGTPCHGSGVHGCRLTKAPMRATVIVQ